MIQGDFLLRCAIGIIAGFLGSAIFAFPAAQAQSRGTKYQRSLKDRHRGRFIAWLKMQDAFRTDDALFVSAHSVTCPSKELLATLVDCRENYF